MDAFDSTPLATSADNATIAALLNDDEESTRPVPSIGVPSGDSVVLPVGRVNPETGVRSTKATVRELTGVHEERISKVDGENIPEWSQVILECGVVSIGDEAATPALLKRLKVGDRDKLLLGISQATFGNFIDIGEVKCSECEKVTPEAVLNTLDVPEVEFTGDDGRTITLPSGRTAQVNLPNGGDQIAYLEDPNLSFAERNTILMSRCVDVIHETSGNAVVIAGDQSYVRNLGIRDREALTRAITDNQPGPRYNNVVVNLDCGHTTSASIGLMHLFPGLW